MVASYRAFFFATFLASAANAQATGFALDRLDPAERGSEWFTTESLDFRAKPVRPAAGVVFVGQYRPLATYNPDGSVASEVVRHSIALHAGVSTVFWERVRLGLDLPMVLYQDGKPATFNGQTYPAPDSPVLGDLRIGLDGRLYGEHDGPFILGIGGRFYLPTGSKSSYASDGVVRFEPRVMAAGGYKMLAYSARIGFQYRDLSGTFADGKIGSEVNFAAAIGARIADKRLVIGPEIFGSTVVTESGAAFSKRSTPLEGLLGAHYTLPTSAGDIRFGGGIGAGLTRGFGAPLVRYLFDLEWALPLPKLPAPPPPPTVVEPAPKVDTDKDGIFDEEDACPKVPGVFDKDPIKNGCPPDKDDDGIPDIDDACPEKPGPKTDNPKTNGCPPDRDGDGIADSDDACPDEPGVPSTDKRFHGCPPDKDKDGIPNETDACPDHPGAPDPDPKKNGCPKAFVQGAQIKIRDQVKFKLNSSEILPGKDSEDVLNAVLKLIKDHPEFKKIRIEGHTSSEGPAELNRKLSAARAESVVKWLVKKGLSKDIFASAGFGPDMPIDTNDTEEGRKNNRRVEFHIVDEKKEGQ